MKKEFTTPEMNVVRIEVEDVLTTSKPGGIGGGPDMGGGDEEG